MTKVDHVLIEVGTPADVFSVLTTELELPVVWPLADYGSFSSGGVSLGNVVVEVGRFGFGPVGTGGGAGLAGIAFEPRESAASSVAELDRRQVAHGLPSPYRAVREGQERVMWINVEVTALPPEDALLFICDYQIDAKSPRAAAGAKLTESHGGPLGLLGVKDIVVGVRDWDGALGKWRTFLGRSGEHEPGVFALGSGPAIRLVPRASDAIEAITLRVASVERAEHFLERRDMLEKGKHGEVLLSGPKLRGLKILVME